MNKQIVLGKLESNEKFLKSQKSDKNWSENRDPSIPLCSFAIIESLFLERNDSPQTNFLGNQKTSTGSFIGFSTF